MHKVEACLKVKENDTVHDGDVWEAVEGSNVNKLIYNDGTSKLPKIAVSLGGSHASHGVMEMQSRELH